ncbi:protein fem-1 homolog C-like [Liolophura sinensis]|uniref:protein fem-1 homolog C-like n=1 Tax=Liolophura sinensis TaxID=3198878 RepID=UPI0031580538
MDNRILAHRGWRITDGLVGSFEMLRAEQGLRDACSSGNRESLQEIARSLPVEKLDEVLSNGRDYPTGTLLCEAILCEQPAILHDLIQLGCDLEQECALDIFFPVPYVDTGPALCVACAIGNVECVSVLLKAGASVNHAGNFGTPLMSACKDGNTQIIDQLLESGANVNLTSRNGNGQTALHISCLAHDNVDNIRTLIAHGANVNHRDRDGHCPAFKACMGANCSVAELLLQHEDLDSSVEEQIQMFWLLGSECAIKLDNQSLAIKYWKWAAVMDSTFGVYHNMLATKLTEAQRNAGIHCHLQNEADLDTLALDPQKVQFQVLLFLYLVFGWGKETVACLTTQMSLALCQQKAWLACQLLMFSSDMADKVSSVDMDSVCENISQTVEDLLDLLLTKSLYPPDTQLNLILHGILSHILKLLEKVLLDPGVATVNALKRSHLQLSQGKCKKDRAEQLIEAFLGVLKYRLQCKVKNSATIDIYQEKVRNFCQLCQLPSSVAMKLNSTLWKIAVHGGPCCKYSLVWQHHNLFPCLQTTKLFIKCGLNFNCIDNKRNTPLHNSLLCQEPSVEIVRLLVESGAEVDLPNKDGVRPCDIIAGKPCYSLCVLRFYSLKSLAARAIVKQQVPFSESLPKTLVEYVEARHVHKPWLGLCEV